MKKTVKIFLLVVLNSGVIANQVWAADPITIDITGRVVSSACTIDSGSVNQDVNFGKQLNTDLKRAGSTTAWFPFSVKMINCPLVTHKVTVTLRGNAFADDPTIFANAGTAENVGVQMAEDNDHSKVLGPGSSMTVNIDDLRQAIFPLAGRLYTATGNTGPGTFSSVVQMDMTYQ